MPTQWEQFSAPTVFRKGDVSVLVNYRPLSLRSVGYKVVAVLALHLMAEGGVEERLRPTQFGENAEEPAMHMFPCRG